MKLKTIICSFSFITLGLNTNNVLITNDNPNSKYQFLKELISSWNDSECSLDFSFEFKGENNKLFTLNKRRNLQRIFC